MSPMMQEALFQFNRFSGDPVIDEIVSIEEEKLPIARDLLFIASKRRKHNLNSLALKNVY